MTLEAGFLAIFLGSEETEPPKAVIWMLRWMLFRLMFGAGLIKLRGDACWRDLTSMFYHYETQPIPSPLSWTFHHLPPVVHKIETLFTHFTEIVVPWGYFIEGALVVWAGIFTFIFQIALILSGNLSWLNYLTLVIAISCFDDKFLRRIIPIGVPVVHPPSRIRKTLIAGLTVFILFLSIPPALNLLSANQMMNTSFEPLHLVNSYGAFGTISRERNEIVLEGTGDLFLSPETEWREYEFKAKPGDPHRRPSLVAPYHLRLDWLMWFAAMGDWRQYPWILTLTAKLLENDEETLKPIEKNPFSNAPPKFIRARLYRYRFTTYGEKRKTGNWWVRELIGEYLPPLSLDNLEFRHILALLGRKE